MSQMFKWSMVDGLSAIARGATADQWSMVRKGRPTTMNHRKKASGEGSVLILALWVLFFLTSLAMAVGVHVSGNLILAARLKTGTTAYYLAKAGVERVILEIGRNSNAWDNLTELWCDNEEIFKDVRLGDGSFCVSCSYTLLPGQVVTNYGVIDEERKININKASCSLLKSLIEIAGELDSMTALEISSSIIDWRDENDEVSQGGAENSYYTQLNQPYSCHNGEFQSLHELLMVKGVWQEIFFKLKPYMTIYGTGRVNINTADPVVLRCLADSYGSADRSICESLVMKIVRFREAGSFFKESSASAIIGQLNELLGLLPAENSLLSEMAKDLTNRSTCFRGIARGKVAEHERADLFSGGAVSAFAGSVTGKSEPSAERWIEFVFDRERGMMLYWHEY